MVSSRDGDGFKRFINKDGWGEREISRRDRKTKHGPLLILFCKLANAAVGRVLQEFHSSTSWEAIAAVLKGEYERKVEWEK